MKNLRNIKVNSYVSKITTMYSYTPLIDIGSTRFTERDQIIQVSKESTEVRGQD